MKIEPVTGDDIYNILQIEEENFTNPWSVVSFFDAILSEQRVFKKACDENELMGYYILFILENEAHLENLSVKPCFQNKGIGRALLQDAIQEAHAHQVEAIYLEVRESNKKAISLYKKAGFFEIGIRKKFYVNPTENAVLMKKTIIKGA